MKNRFQSVLIFVLMLLPNPAKAEEVVVTVKGMVCSFCAQGIKKTFGKMESVKSVNVDLEKKVVTLETRDAEGPSDEEIKSKITDAGYDVLSIERVQHD